jgi:monomeric sarcosine oxidase
VRTRYDHIVVGAGGLGVATAYWLSQVGDGEVLVLDQYELGHPWGASEDHSRIIRHCYHSPDYTALTPAMYETWRHVERAAGVPLLTLCGCLNLAVEGTVGADEMALFARSMAVADIPYNELTGAEIARRWPEWRLPGDSIGLFHREAGSLDFSRANAAHVQLARAHGATFVEKTPVVALEPRSDGVAVRTDEVTFVGGSVVVCAGAWSPPLLATAGVELPLVLSQEQGTYFAVDEPERFTPDRWPVWIWHADSVFYGFPTGVDGAVKAARDMAGRFVTQETRQWEPDPGQTAVVTEFLRERLPAAAGRELYSKTCVYDMPPDRELLIDRVPGEPRLLVAAGAGHAAKFASLIGRILADLTTTGETAYPIEAFRFDRPALTDPDFVETLRLSGGALG